MESLYRESVFRYYKDNSADLNSFIKKHNNKLLAYGSVCEMLKSCFNRKPRVYFFESLLKSDLPIEHNFLKNLGYEVLDLTTVGQIRKSLNNAQLFIKKLLNKHITSDDQDNRVIAWLKLPETEKLLNNCFSNHNRLSLWQSTSERKWCLSLAEQELQKLGCIINIDPKDMFPKLNQHEDIAQEEIKDPELTDVAQLILAALEYENFSKSKNII